MHNMGLSFSFFLLGPLDCNHLCSSLKWLEHATAWIFLWAATVYLNWQISILKRTSANFKLCSSWVAQLSVYGVVDDKNYWKYKIISRCFGATKFLLVSPVVSNKVFTFTLEITCYLHLAVVLEGTTSQHHDGNLLHPCQNLTKNTKKRWNFWVINFINDSALDVSVSWSVIDSSQV